MKNNPAQQLAWRYVKHYGQVGCGAVVPFPFVPKDELVPVLIPDHLSIEDENIGVMSVSGPSLQDLGINDGDELICQRKFSWSQITEDRICVVYIRSTGEVLAKKIVRGANMIILRSAGGGFKDRYVKPDDLEIQSIVIKHSRTADPKTGSFTKKRSKPIRTNGSDKAAKVVRIYEEDYPF